MNLTIGRLVLAVLVVMQMGYLPLADAAQLPDPNGVIAFVRADGCQLDSIKSKVNAAGETLAKDKTVTFVAVDVAAYPDNNLDMFGNPSPYIAAVEANQTQGSVAQLVNKTQQALGTQCKVDVFSVHKRRITSPVRTWALGTPTPGGKGFMLLVRKEATTPEFFYEQWSGPHVEITLRRDQAAQASAQAVQPSQATQPAVGRRYIHNYVLARSDGALAFDGIAEGGILGGAPTPESIKRVKEMAASPSPSEVQKHATVFMNMDKTQMFSVQETILKD